MSAVRCIRRAGASYVGCQLSARTLRACTYVCRARIDQSFYTMGPSARTRTHARTYAQPVVFTFTLSAIGRESRCTPIRSARADRAVPACPCAHALSIARSAMSSGQRVVMLSCPLDLSDNWLSLTGITRRKADTGSTYARTLSTPCTTGQAGQAGHQHDCQTKADNDYHTETKKDRTTTDELDGWSRSSCGRDCRARV